MSKQNWEVIIQKYKQGRPIKPRQKSIFKSHNLNVYSETCKNKCYLHTYLCLSFSYYRKHPTLLILVKKKTRYFYAFRKTLLFLLHPLAIVTAVRLVMIWLMWVGLCRSRSKRSRPLNMEPSFQITEIIDNFGWGLSCTLVLFRIRTVVLFL